MVKQETLTFNGFVVNAHVVGDNEVEGDIQSFTDTHAILKIDKKRILNVDKNILLSEFKVCAPRENKQLPCNLPSTFGKGHSREVMKARLRVALYDAAMSFGTVDGLECKEPFFSVWTIRKFNAGAITLVPYSNVITIVDKTTTADGLRL